MLSSPGTAEAVKAETMHRIFFENVRCFSSRQQVPLAPLTVLVGENGSGKSTFLALVRLAWDLAKHMRTPDFSEEPFLLGAYDQIASFGSRESFVIGAEISSTQGPAAFINGVFESRLGQPALARLSLGFPHYHVDVCFKKDNGSITSLTLKAPSGQVRAQREEFLREFGSEVKPLLILAGLFAPRGDSVFGFHGSFADQQDFDRISRGIEQIQVKGRPCAFAPVRTRPQRTYDPIKSMESPEGSHVPLILASTPLRQPKKWKGLFDALDSFGRQSGLFQQVEVRRLGQSESDPFQIRVHVGGNAVNLIDVGYGVSQVLPIVVESLRGKEGGIFLLQQPEVHLHPKAQAELGSFFGMLAKRQDKRFVIETHSDYLVDRIRMDVRDKKNGLRPEDVSLLYFERRNGEAQIHRLELDEHGNIVNAPPGYRSFFLEEERRFLGG